MDARKSFKDIKRAITEAPVFMSPNFAKDFLVFSYAHEHTIVGVLLQKKKPEC